MAPLAPLLSLALLAAATAQSPPAAASPTPPPAAASLRLWLRPEGLGDGSRAVCSGQAIPVWRNAAPLAATFLLGHDASVPALQTAPSRLYDNVSGACVARFTASAGTALAVPTLDLTAPSQSYTVTIVARMWAMDGANRGRVISNAVPGSRDWLMGWHNTRSDLAYYDGSWLGGVPGGLFESWGSRDWIIYTLTRDGAAGGASVLYKNGNMALTGPLRGGPMDLRGGPAGILLGGANRGQVQQLGELSDCDVAEVLVHDAALPHVDRIRLEGDLAVKYRASHRLPAGHPSYAARLPAFAPSALPAPLVWLRPDTGLTAFGTVEVWDNGGSGGVGFNGVFAGSGGSTAPVITRARFVNGTAFSALRFTSAQCSRLFVPINLNADSQSSTIVAVSRMWGATRRRVISSNAMNWLFGWYGGRMDVLHIDDGKSWLHWPGLLALPEFGGYSWQLHASTRRGANGSVPSEVAFYSNGAELARAINRGGFLNPSLGGAGCDQSSDADVAELLIWDYELSPDELAAVTSYLQGRYVIGGNEPLEPSAPPTTSVTASGSPSPGASPTVTATTTTTALRCAVDESFVSGDLPLTWTASPPSLVSVVTSAAPRGTFGSTIYDPLSTGSPFAHLRSGAGIGEYTSLSIVIATEASAMTVSADVQFDAGTELPFNDDAFVAVTQLGQPRVGRVNTCGVARRVGDYVALACPSGQTILSVPFVSYGNPTLSGCEAGQYAYGACHANSSLSSATLACVGQTSCSVQLTSTAAVACSVGATDLPSLAIVAECSAPGVTGVVYTRSVASVGAYTQSGWTRVSTTLGRGEYRLTFGVRSVGASDPARASALAVDNVLACLQPVAASSSSPLPVSASPVPSPVGTQLSDAVQVSFLSAGAIHTCGVTPLNRLLCWGGNVRWWDGASSAVEGQATVPPELAFANVSTVSAGDVHTCVVLSDGRVRCFGGNWAGQTSVPTLLSDGRVPAVSVAAGHDFSCAITTVGETLCWGNIGAPPAVLFRGTIAIAAGYGAACAVTAYRTVVCWGAIAQPPAGVVSAQLIVMSGYPLIQACAVTSSGLVCWGAAELASFTATSSVAVMTEPFDLRILGADGSVVTAAGDLTTSRRVAVTCGRLHCCYQFKDNGTTSCDGDNLYGQGAPPLRQPFATPLPRFYPPVTASVPTLPPSEPCSSDIGTSAALAALDCAEYAARACDRSEGVRWITDRSGTAYEAVCFDGYALAMKLSRSGTIFRYASGFWTNSSLHNGDPASVGEAADAKLAPFLNQRLSAILVRNRAANTSAIVRGVTADSLAAMFVSLNGRERFLFGNGQAQRDAWLSLAPGICTQPNCNTVGLNTARFVGVPGRLVFMMNNEGDCGNPDTGIAIGSRDGNSLISCVDSSSPSLELFVSGPPYAAALTSATATRTVSATLSPGASASATATVVASIQPTPSISPSPPATPSRSASPPSSGTPTGTLTLRASASTTATGSLTATPTASPSGTPYCATGEYQYFPGYDVDGNATLGAASVGSERDCARACCDVPACDGYSFVNNQFVRLSEANCIFVGNVTGIARNRLLNGGVRKRVL